MLIPPTTQSLSSTPSSKDLILTEQQSEIHAYMERQAELRILRRVAAQDPEIGALIEGKIVDSPIDPEIFKLKQVRNFVELIGTSGRSCSPIPL